jgi:hypothetical protein
MYVDNDFIWWISPRSLAIYFQLNFFFKVTKNHLVMSSWNRQFHCSRHPTRSSSHEEIKGLRHALSLAKRSHFPETLQSILESRSNQQCRLYFQTPPTRPSQTHAFSVSSAYSCCSRRASYCARVCFSLQSYFRIPRSSGSTDDVTSRDSRLGPTTHLINLLSCSYWLTSYVVTCVGGESGVSLYLSNCCLKQAVLNSCSKQLFSNRTICIIEFEVRVKLRFYGYDWVFPIDKRYCSSQISWFPVWKA